MTDQTKKIESTSQAAQSPSGNIEVDNIHEFVHYLNSWHSSKVQELRHMIDMPEGITMVTEENGVEKSVLMEGVMLAGFKAGVELALMQLGTLPFSAELEDGTTH